MLVLDTTLRDGEQTPGVSLTPEQKLSIAKALDELGVDIIEAGSAITSEGEQEGIKAITSEGLKAEIASYSRIMKSDIDTAIKCGVDCIFLVAPTSDLHIKYKLGTNRDKLLEKTLESIEYCKQHDLVVDLCCEDGSRTEVAFLRKLLDSASEYHIDRFTIADTVGIMTPEKIELIYSELAKTSRVCLGVHCHDDLGLATANTLSAVLNGAEAVDVTINGLGERAGNAPLEEVIMALKLAYGRETKIKTEKLSHVSNLVEKLCGIPVPPNKAIVGENAFTHEAGIHVDGILKKPETYEVIKPELVGRKRSFVLGKHVGLKSIKKALDEMELKVDDKKLGEIFRKVKYEGDKGKKITSTDLEYIAKTIMGEEIKHVLNLEELVAVAGNKITPTASVKMTVNGNEIVESAVGNGPVDAAIKAIRNATRGIPFELVEYHVDSVSGGTDAVVQVTIELKSKDKIVKASGTGGDIVLASVDAMIAGINAVARKLG